MADLNKGRIKQVIGPVVDIEFSEDNLPELLNAVEIKMDDKTIVVWKLLIQENLYQFQLVK
jgi:F-type H+-transporting ATPase subunit beta